MFFFLECLNADAFNTACQVMKMLQNFVSLSLSEY